nr:hypothetical protein [Staphylococcus aureus]WPG18886.1 hypothetical protein SGX79_14405 [Staphylococcus aureus]
MKRTLIIVTIVLLIIILSLLLVRNEHLDRFNPLLKRKSILCQSSKRYPGL